MKLILEDGSLEIDNNAAEKELLSLLLSAVKTGFFPICQKVQYLVQLYIA